MNADVPSNHVALAAAEEVLRAIYGDDLAGCTTSLDAIAAIIQTAVGSSAQQQALLDLYEQLVEALHRISTPPPDASKGIGADELRTLLSDRLDAIHALTTKTLETTALLRQQSSRNGSERA